MAKKATKGRDSESVAKAPAAGKPAVSSSNRPSALLDTRVVYCGDNLEQLAKLPDKCLRRAPSSRVDLIYIDPAPVSEVELPALVSEVEPFNSNRNYEVFWGETGACSPTTGSRFR